LEVYTWFPYQSSYRCTEVNDITLLDSWVISAQGPFTKNTDLFPGKISNNLNICPMKAVVLVSNDNSDFITRYVERTYLNWSVVRNREGLEIKLPMVVLQQMNMTLVLVHSPEPGEIEDEALLNYLLRCLYTKESYVTVGYMGIDSSVTSLFESTNPYFFFRIRCYVPCSVKYPRWSSIFRILSVELWLVLIISVVIAAISTTLVGRYSCTSEWQVYKTLTSSLTNIWVVILGVSVSTMPSARSLRSLFLAWVCFSVAFSTVFQAFLTTFLIDSGYKTPIQNMDELFSSGIKLAKPPNLDVIV